MEIRWRLEGGWEDGGRVNISFLLFFLSHTYTFLQIKIYIYITIPYT